MSASSSPFAPPATPVGSVPSPSDPGKSAFILLGVVTGLTILTATALRVSALKPSGLLPKPLYNTVFSLHGSLALSFYAVAQFAAFSVALRPSAEARWVRAANACMLMLVIQTLGSAVTATLELSKEVALILFHAANLTVAGWGLSAAWRLRKTSAIAATLAVVTAVALPWALTARTELLFVWCLLLLWQPPDIESSRPRRLVAALLLLLVALAFRAFAAPIFEVPVFEVLSVLRLLVLLAVAPIAWRHLDQLRDRGALRDLAKAGLVVSVVSAFLSTFLEVVVTDIHLNDTLLVIADAHAVAFGVLLLLAFVGLSRWTAIRVEKCAAVRLGIWVGTSLLLAIVFLFFGLGWQGMPRRYQEHLDEFTNLQQATSVATLLLMIAVGFTVWKAASTVAGRREKD